MYLVLQNLHPCTQSSNIIRKMAINTNCNESFGAGTLSRSKRAEEKAWKEEEEQKIIGVFEVNVSAGTEKYICH